MPTLENYTSFAGRHWETGSVCNVFDYRGFKAPHTGLPYSEALLVGVSGGAVMAYFSFAYEGYDPHVALLTRNTFDPLNTLLARLGVTQDVRQTTNPGRAVKHLVDVLESGVPALVWADVYSLPYNAQHNEKGMWIMYPVVVYGYEPEAGRVLIADRSCLPLEVTPAELEAARARVKKDKFRVLALSAPDESKLAAAVQQGLWDCVRLYTEAPPAGSRHNFGLAAYRRWADMLLKPGERQSWARVFPPGRPMYAGLTTAYRSLSQFNEGEDAERGAFAAFLEEAAQLLERPGLRPAAELFREAGGLWAGLARALLPEEVQPLGEARRLIRRQQELFREQGQAALPEMRENNDRLEAIAGEMERLFPLDEAGVNALCAGLAEQLMALHDTEAQAVKALQEGMR